MHVVLGPLGRAARAHQRGGPVPSERPRGGRGLDLGDRGGEELRPLVEVDHDRRRLRLGAAELGLLVALAGGAGVRLAGRPEAAGPTAELTRAGVLRDGAPAGWPGRLAAAVAHPDARLEVERPDAPAHRAWVAGEDAVIGRERGDGFELALVRRSLVLAALVRALGLPAPPPAKAPRVAGADELAGARAWRFSAGEETVTVVEADGLWLSEPQAGDRVALTPLTLPALLERLAALLGMRLV